MACPRQPPPRFLSPILETEEEKHDHQTTKQILSAVDMGQQAKPCGFNVPSYSSDSLAISPQSYIESSSGRKRDDVEVLKQKYINKDIQDLPRLVLGPVKYGRLHRSRSNINLGSQDIRNQLTKLRMKMKRCSSDIVDKKQAFRYGTLSRQPQNIGKSNRKSIKDALYSDIVDDFEPELVALFENYIDERDQLSRRQIEGHVAPDLPSGLPSDQEERCRYPSCNLHVEPGAKHAYMYGFLQGLNHQILKEVSASRSQQSTTDPNTDTCVGTHDFRDLIVHNQDVTHKHLRNWENNFSHSATTLECDVEKSDDNHVSRDHSASHDYVRKSSEKGSTEHGSKLTGSSSGKQSISQETLTLGTPTIDFPVQFVKPVVHLVDLNGKPRSIKPKGSSTSNESLSKSRSSVHTSRNEETDDFKTRDLMYASDGCSGRSSESRAEPDGEEQTMLSVNDDQNHLHKYGSNEDDEMFGHSAPSQSDGQWHQSTSGIEHTYLDAHASYPSIVSFDMTKPLNDAELSIVKLAKRKFENKLMSSLVFEETFHNGLRGRKLTSGGRNETRRQRVKTESHSVKNPDVITVDDLDGWSTQNKDNFDMDNLHLSESELLHPVDSIDVPPTSPTAPSSTPKLPHLLAQDNRMISTPCEEIRTQSIIGTIEIPTCSAVADSYLPDSGNGTISGDKTGVPVSNDKTGASISRNSGQQEIPKKPRSAASVPGDYRKALKLVKLRLTKSTPAVEVPIKAKSPTPSTDPGDKSVPNIPLSHSANYNIEQNLKANLSTSTTTTTTSINLSETLAKQLKDLSQNIQKSRAATALQSYSSYSSEVKVCKAEEKNSTSSIDNELPIIAGSRMTVATPVAKDKCDECRLPDISVSGELCGSYDKNSIQRQKANKHTMLGVSGNENVDLPPISVTPLPCKTPSKDEFGLSGTPSRELEDDFYIHGSIAVRAGVCTSPYMFDKEDPGKLQLKAKSLPHLHNVCTCCGGITETEAANADGRFGKVRREKKRKEISKFIHQKCSGHCMEDTWQLEKSRTTLSNEMPKVSGKRLTHAQTNYVDSMKPKSAQTLETLVPPSSRKHAACEEMAIRFMDQDIKVKFQCEVSLGKYDSGTKLERTNKWLENMATPNCREKLECPVATETRIYMEKPKRPSKQTLEFPEKDLPNSKRGGSVNSPYIDYCKRQAEQRKSGKRRLLDEFTEVLSASSLTEKQLMAHVRGQKGRYFPVIPMKKEKSRRSGRANAANKVEPNKKSKKHLLLPLGHVPAMKMNNNNTSDVITSLEYSMGTSDKCPIPPCNSLAKIVGKPRRHSHK